MASRISIGIPFYNAEATLPDAIRSVFAQTTSDWTLYLIDDGSSDRSLEIARTVSDPRVRVISDGKNLGLVGRLNQLAQLTKTPLLARMDADDLMHPDRLARQEDYLSAHPEIDVVGTGMISIDGQSLPRGMRGCQPGTSSAKSALRHVPFLHPSIMGRTTWFQENPYDPRYVRVEDGELAARTLAAGRLSLANIEEPLLFYREPHEFAVAKVLATYRGRRRLVWQHAPSQIGYFGTFRCLAELFAKQLSWQVLGSLGQQYHLIKRRNQPLAEQHVSTAKLIIERIQGTPVPGWAKQEKAA